MNTLPYIECPKCGNSWWKKNRNNYIYNCPICNIPVIEHNINSLHPSKLAMVNLRDCYGKIKMV